MSHSRLAVIDSELVWRIESTVAEDVRLGVVEACDHSRCPESTFIRIAGGVAAFRGQNSLLNGAIGLGLGGPVEAEEVAMLVDFFESRGLPAHIDVCPYADDSLLLWLAHFGFVVTGFEMVLAQPLADGRLRRRPRRPDARQGRDGGVRVRTATSDEERDTWATLVAAGFSGGTPTDLDIECARALAGRPGTVHFIGYLNEEPAGAGLMRVSDGVAFLAADATRPAHRRRGVQQALLAARVSAAREAGCDLAVIEAAPGGVSMRNQQRAGFMTMYTRVSFERPMGGVRPDPLAGAGQAPPPGDGDVDPAVDPVENAP